MVARKSNESNENLLHVWMMMNRRTFQVITAAGRGHTSKSMNRTSHTLPAPPSASLRRTLGGGIVVGHTRQRETSCLSGGKCQSGSQGISRIHGDPQP